MPPLSRIGPGMDEHRPAVRQPRRARHIDHLRRDRPKTGAAAISDPDADGVVGDTHEPETIGRNPAATGAALQEPRFTTKRRNLVHIRARIVAGSKNDSGVFR